MEISQMIDIKCISYDMKFPGRNSKIAKAQLRSPARDAYKRLAKSHKLVELPYNKLFSTSIN